MTTVEHMYLVLKPDDVDSVLDTLAREKWVIHTFESVVASDGGVCCILLQRLTEDPVAADQSGGMPMSP